MPHKKNPVLSENLTGIARLIRGSVIPMMENITLWHERDISHSSVERILCPDTLALMDFALYRMKEIIKNLVINKNTMKNNLTDTKGLYNSQRVMLELIKKGISREKAYKIVQKTAMKSWKTKLDFQLLLQRDKEIKKYLNKSELRKLFDTSYHLKNIDKIFKRVLK